MRTVLIHHRSSRLDEVVLAPWLASFSELVGIVVLEEPRGQLWLRLKRELRRVGRLRLLDVFGFRAYYALRLAARDARWEQAAISELAGRFPPLPDEMPRLVSASPNSPEVVAFLEDVAPDLVLARSKLLIVPAVFSLPPLGTFVLHPGATPEYRNSHGCFWALAHREPDKAVVSLVRIDAGVDTGPVYGYFSYDFDERSESHVVIQKRAVLENLDDVAARLCEIADGTATPIDTTGRASAAWGQPWLTAYLRWKRDARRTSDVVALGYHDVFEADPDESGFPGRAPAFCKLPRADFERHLDAIESTTGGPPLQAAEILARRQRSGWALTFDDGGASAPAVAEMLTARGWCGHFFVTTDRLGDPGFVDADAIRKVHALGHVVGTHSCSHPERMSRCTRAELEREWRESIAILGEIVGEPITTASVPGGFFKAEVAKAAAAEGIRLLFTSEPNSTPYSVDGCVVLGRMPITAHTSAERVAGLAAGRQLPHIRARVVWRARKVAKAVGGPLYIRVRREILTRR